MTDPEERSSDLTADEIAAATATDPSLEQAQIIARAGVRVLAIGRARLVAAAWQRVTTMVDQPAKALREGEPLNPVPEQLVKFWLISGNALVDPWYRDLHLAKLDRWLLPELQQRQLSLRELEEVVVGLPHDLSALLAPQANVLCPQLWRWLRDAEGRRLIRPASNALEPTAHTRWDLTEAGERAVRWTRPLSGRLLHGISGNVGTFKEVGGLFVSLLAAIGLLVPDTRDTLLRVAIIALLLSAGIFAGVVAEDLWVWWRRLRNPRGPVYQAWGKMQSELPRFGILREAGLQQALAIESCLPRTRMEPPPT